MEAMWSGLLRASLGAGILIGLLLLLRRSVRIPARVQYALWLLVALRLLLPVEIGVPALPMEQTKRPAAQPTVSWREAGERTLLRESLLAERNERPTSGATSQVGRDPSPMALLKAIWLTGAAALTLYTAVSNARFRRHLRRARVRGLTESERYLYMRLCKALSIARPPRVGVYEPLSSSCLYGILRPRIALSLDAAQEQNLADVLTHELCHYRQADPIWTALRGTCMCLYWFHPLVWLGAQASIRDGEAACDAHAVAGRSIEGIVRYGHTLLRMSARREHLHPLVWSTTMRLRESAVRERIERMLTEKRAAHWKGVLCTVLMLLLTVGTFAVAEPAGEEKRVIEDQEAAQVGAHIDAANAEAELEALCARFFGAEGWNTGLHVLSQGVGEDVDWPFRSRALWYNLDKTHYAYHWAVSPDDPRVGTIAYLRTPQLQKAGATLEDARALGDAWHFYALVDGAGDVIRLEREPLYSRLGLYSFERNAAFVPAEEWIARSEETYGEYRERVRPRYEDTDSSVALVQAWLRSVGWADA